MTSIPLVVIKNCSTCGHGQSGVCMLVQQSFVFARQAPFSPLCDRTLSGWAPKEPAIVSLPFRRPFAVRVLRVLWRIVRRLA